MIIASFAGLVFETADGVYIAPDNITRSASYATEKQDVEGGKAKTIRKGPALQTMSMSVLLSQGLGISVSEHTDALFDLCESGEAYPFYLNGKPVGSNKWQITAASQSETVLDGKGNILQAKIALTFTEWVAAGVKTSTPKTSFGASSASKPANGFAAVDTSKYEKAAPTAQEKNQVKRPTVKGKTTHLDRL